VHYIDLYILAPLISLLSFYKPEYMVLSENRIASVKGFVKGVDDVHSALRTTNLDFLLFWRERNVENDEATEMGVYGAITPLPPFRCF